MDVDLGYKSLDIIITLRRFLRFRSFSEECLRYDPTCASSKEMVAKNQSSLSALSVMLLQHGRLVLSISQCGTCDWYELLLLQLLDMLLLLLLYMSASLAISDFLQRGDVHQPAMLQQHHRKSTL